MQMIHCVILLSPLSEQFVTLGGLFGVLQLPIRQNLNLAVTGLQMVNFTPSCAFGFARREERQRSGPEPVVFVGNIWNGVSLACFYIMPRAPLGVMSLSRL